MSDFDLAALHRHLAERLPAYARPLFIRIRPALEITGTFKQKKQELIDDGFDPASGERSAVCRRCRDRQLRRA